MSKVSVLKIFPRDGGARSRREAPPPPRHEPEGPATGATATWHSDSERLASPDQAAAWHSDSETAQRATATWHSDSERLAPPDQAAAWHSDSETAQRATTTWHGDSERLAPPDQAAAWHSDSETAGHSTARHRDSERLASAGHVSAWHSDSESAGYGSARHGDHKRPVSARLAAPRRGDPEPKGYAAPWRGDPERPAPAGPDAARRGVPERKGHAATGPSAGRPGDPEPAPRAGEPPPVTRVYVSPCNEVTDLGRVRERKARAITNADPTRIARCNASYVQKGVVRSLPAAPDAGASPVPPARAEGPGEVGETARATAAAAAAAAPLSISLPTEVRRERTVRKATGGSLCSPPAGGQPPCGAFARDAAADLWGGGDGAVGGYGAAGDAGAGDVGGVARGDAPASLTSAADINLIATSVARDEAYKEEDAPAASPATTTAATAVLTAAASAGPDPRRVEPGAFHEEDIRDAGRWSGAPTWLTSNGADAERREPEKVAAAAVHEKEEDGGAADRLQRLSVYGGAVPILGPVENPVSEGLTETYRERAKQARLHRSESSSERQVKEAKTRCRTIASLLTEAPDPHSRGVLMFKKRRLRAKRYTLVSFGEGDGTDGGGGVDADAGLDTDAAPCTSDSELDDDSAFADLEREMEGERARSAAAAQPGAADGLSGRGAEMFKERQRNAGAEPAVNGDAPEEWVFLGTEELAAPRSGRSQQEARSKFFEEAACGEARRGTAQRARPSQWGAAAGAQGHGAATQSSCAFVQPMVQAGHQTHAPPPPPAFQQQTAAFSSSKTASASRSSASTVTSSSVTVDGFRQQVTQQQQQQHQQQVVVKTKQAGNVVNRTARPFTPAGPVENRAATPFVAQPAVAPRVGEAAAAADLPARESAAQWQGHAAGTAEVTPPVAPRQRPSVNINYVSAQSSQRGAGQHAGREAAAAGSQPEASPVADAAPAPAWSSANAQQPEEGGLAGGYFAPASPRASRPAFANNPSVGAGDPPAYQPVTSQTSPAATAGVVPPPPPYARPAAAVSHGQAPPPTPVAPLPQQPQQTPASSVILPPPPFAQYSEPEQDGDAAAFNGTGADAASTSTDRDRASAIRSPEPPLERLSSREQRISVPAARSGILAEAKKRNQGNKAMFTFKEPPKNSPNPDLLSLVQNLDDKTKPEGQFEGGPEEDSLGLGAEASNFWQTQAQAQGFKSPPPVAPKPTAKVQGYEAYPPPAAQAPSWNRHPQAGAGSDPLPSCRAAEPQAAATAARPAAEGPRRVLSPENNGLAARNKAAQSAAAVLASDMSQMKGKGAQLFAKRQSRMEKYVVDGTPSPAEEARGPSPTPSLPCSWKYSSQIRAPPPIGFNPILSPFYPLAAAKGQAAQGAPKSPAAAKTKGKPKPKMEKLDVMKHQPYQLNSAMFSFSPPAAAAAGGPGRQAQSLPRNAVPPTAQQQAHVTTQPPVTAPATVTTQLQMEVRSMQEKPAQQQHQQQQQQQQQPTKSFATVLPQQINGVSTSSSGASSSPQPSAWAQPVVSAPSLNGPANHVSGDEAQSTALPPLPAHQHRVTSHIQVEVRSTAGGGPSGPAANSWQQPPPNGGLAPAYPGGHQPPPYPGHAGDFAGPAGFGAQLPAFPAEPPGRAAAQSAAAPRPSFSAKKNGAQAQVWRPGVAN